MNRLQKVVDCLNEARGLQKQKQWKEALECYRQVIILRPGNAGAYQNIGDIFIELNQLEDAISNYYKALELRPNSLGLRVKLCGILQKTHKFSEAITCCQAGLDNDPDNIALLNKMGGLYSKMQQFDRSVDFYQRVVSLGAGSPKIFIRLALIFEKLDRIDDAIIALQEALNLDSKSLAAYHHIGNMFVRKGQVQRAIEAYQTVLAINPSHKASRKKIALLLNHADSSDADGKDMVSSLHIIEGVQLQENRIRLPEMKRPISYGKSRGKSGSAPFKKHKRRNVKSIQTDMSGFRDDFQFSPESVGNYDQYIKPSSKITTMGFIFSVYGIIAIVLFLQGLQWLSIVMIAIFLGILVLFWGFTKRV